MGMTPYAIDEDGWRIPHVLRSKQVTTDYGARTALVYQLAKQGWRPKMIAMELGCSHDVAKKLSARIKRGKA